MANFEKVPLDTLGERVKASKAGGHLMVLLYRPGRCDICTDPQNATLHRVKKRCDDHNVSFLGTDAKDEPGAFDLFDIPEGVQRGLPKLVFVVDGKASLPTLPGPADDARLKAWLDGLEWPAGSGSRGPAKEVPCEPPKKWQLPCDGQSRSSV